MTPLEIAQEKAEAIKAVVLTGENGRIPTLLREIKTHLAANPDVVTLLAPEEIANILKGIYMQQGIAMEGPSKKKATAAVAAAKKKTAGYSLDDV